MGAERRSVASWQSWLGSEEPGPNDLFQRSIIIETAATQLPRFHVIDWLAIWLLIRKHDDSDCYLFMEI